MAYIECRNVVKSYGKDELSISVLKDLHLNVERGETLAIVGASGSGKSTLLHLLAGLDLPDSGTIIANQQLISDMHEDARCRWRGKEVGFIYQFYHLLAEFTLLENVMMPIWIAGERQRQTETRAIELLEIVGLGKRLKHKPDELSGGEQQRVAICRALIAKPQYVFADEPTGNLDAKTAVKVTDILLELNRKDGTTLLTATHDLELAQCFDRVYHLKGGKLHQAYAESQE